MKKWKVFTNKYYWCRGEYIVEAATEQEAIDNWEQYKYISEIDHDDYELEDDQFDWVEVIEEPSQVEF